MYGNNVFSAQHSSADFTTFLDDFVFNVFLPQIGDKIFELFRQATTGNLIFPEFQLKSVEVAKFFVQNRFRCIPRRSKLQNLFYIARCQSKFDIIKYSFFFEFLYL